MKLADLQTLLDYHYWARDRMLDAAGLLSSEQYTRDLGNSFGSVRDTIVHTFSAEWVWQMRWAGTSPTALLAPQDYPDVETIRATWIANEAKLREYVSSVGEEGLERVYEYRMLNGQPSASVFGHIVQHLVNHGTYHRGQVTTMIRQLGSSPPKSQDLIAFYRERHLG